jgi:hypothetical protein
VGAPELRVVAFELGKRAEQLPRRRRRHQRGEQQVLMRAVGIDGIDSVIGHGAFALVIEIGAQVTTRDAGGSLDRNHTLSRHPVPVGNRGLGNANFPGKFGDSAYLVDCAR